jgi:hypothetical protein
MSGGTRRPWWTRVWWGQWVAFAGGTILALAAVALGEAGEGSPVGAGLAAIAALWTGVGLRALATWRDHLEARS